MAKRITFEADVLDPANQVFPPETAKATMTEEQARAIRQAIVFVRNLSWINKPSWPGPLESMVYENTLKMKYIGGDDGFEPTQERIICYDGSFCFSFCHDDTIDYYETDSIQLEFLEEEMVKAGWLSEKEITHEKEES